MSVGVKHSLIGNRATSYVIGVHYKRDFGDNETRITVNNLHFPADKADLFGPENERSREDRRIINGLYRTLRRYPEHTIIIEGHTSFVYWDDPEKADVEQRSVLLPLSRRRAEAVMNALLDSGIPASRMTAVGKGGSAPVVPFKNRDLQWRNRRVGIILIPPQRTSE